MWGTPYDFFVQWHLTDKCNLSCKHCYQDGAVVDMTYTQIREAMDNVVEAFRTWVTEYQMEMSPSFHFTGGEPLIRQDVFSILNYAFNKGFSTSLMTNGTLVTSDVALKLRQTQVRDVQISLDGLKSVHESMRGKGSFARAEEGINNLIDKGIPTNINLTLSRINAGEIGGLISLAQKLGVGAVTFSRLVPCGHGEELRADVLSTGELATIYDELHRYEAGGDVRISSLDPLFSVAAMKGQVVEAEFPVGGCAAGIFGVTVAADGSVMPCRRMNMVIGNIKEQSFRELWAESPALWSLRSREDYHGGCESCIYWSVCRGCRAIALTYARHNGSEDFLGPDPQCSYYRAECSAEPHV